MKKTARYVISAALILCMVFALSACGFSTDSPAGVLTRSAMALKDKDNTWNRYEDKRRQFTLADLSQLNRAWESDNRIIFRKDGFHSCCLYFAIWRGDLV